MTPAEQLAEKAWEGISRVVSPLKKLVGEEAMPPAIAIDMVQDETGSRDKAVELIVKAAAEWLILKAPPVLHAFSGDCDSLIWSLRAQDFDRAVVYSGAIENEAVNQGQWVLASNLQGSRSGVFDYDNWRQWALTAYRTIEKCREVCKNW